MLATKSPKANTTRTAQTHRAKLSQRPCKRGSLLLPFAEPTVSYVDADEGFMHVISEGLRALSIKWFLSPILPYARLLIVTKSVTNCQTSGTVAGISSSLYQRYQIFQQSGIA